MNMTGYEFFKIYAPLKLHFTQDSYDGFKYNWKTRSITSDAFTKRKDRYLFEKWGKHCDNQMEAGNLIVSNFAYTNDAWLYEDIEEAKTIYIKWKATKESITKTFEDDLREVSSHNLKTWKAYVSKTPKGNVAPLLQLYLAKRIHPESIVILDYLCSIIGKWENEYELDPLVKNEIVKLKKYAPFVKFDKSRVKAKFKEFLEESHEATV